MRPHFYRLLLPAVFTSLAAPLLAAALQRGPYLQMSTASSVVVVWRTQGASHPVLRYGHGPGDLSQRVTGNAITLRASAETPVPDGTPRLYQEPASELKNREADHDPSTPPNTFQYEARVTGLQPGTKYFYAVHDGDQRLAGGDAEHSFITHAPIGSPTDLRLWVVGDSGTGGKDQAMVHDAMRAHVAKTGRRIDHYLHVGDMAYGDGTDREFQNHFFTPYQATLRNTVCWPAMGNHEGHTSRGLSGSGPYYDAYVVPTRAEAGGLPSGTEAYYSFELSGAHFICLDSHDLDRGSDSAMAQWLRADLEQTRAQWLIAFWHHPPYTKGSHDSDRERQLVEMRENFMPILEAAGVDLTLTGHSHIYERSMLMDGAYATPTTAAGVILDDGDGNPAGDGAYVKSAGLRPHGGSVSVVAGHGGTGLGREGTMPVMRQIILEHGSVILDIKGDTLTGIMLNKRGETRDTFSIVKRGSVTPVRVAKPWQPVHDISLLTSIRLEFDAASPGTAPQGWSAVTGSGGMRVMAAEGERRIVRVEAKSQEALLLYTPWSVAAFEFAASMRFPSGAAAQAGLVFGYVDPRNYHRVVLDSGAGVIRVSRLVDGAEGILGEKPAPIVANAWLNLEIEVQDGEVEVQFQDDLEQRPELEFAVKLVAPAPRSSVGFLVTRGSSVDVQWFAIEDEGERP